MSVASLFDHDIGDLLALLPDLEHAWTEEVWRQSMPYSPHRDSQTIMIRRQPGSRPRDVLHQIASVATQHYMHAPIAAAIHQICAQIEGRPARAMLVRLAPGGVIAPHTDEGIYFGQIERFHLPLVTNPGAWLEVDGERYHLAAGTVYAFDNHVPHCGANEGDVARVHLLVDVHPDSPFVSAG